MQRKMYHTQEHRGPTLVEPIICMLADAWLGDGYYFWYDYVDSQMWGEQFKLRTGQFDIYCGEIDCSHVLDTVFNEEQYLFWKDLVEYAAKEIQKKTTKEVGIKELNDYFRTRGTWNEVSGILFQDLPRKHKTGMIKGLHYRKRIQVVVYDTNIIHNFAHYYRSPRV